MSDKENTFEENLAELEALVKKLEAGNLDLDESLKKHETVYPAAGSDHSAVRLSIAELEKSSGAAGWVDVCKSEETV